jgi:hypothetical protein
MAEEAGRGREKIHNKRRQKYKTHASVDGECFHYFCCVVVSSEGRKKGRNADGVKTNADDEEDMETRRCGTSIWYNMIFRFCLCWFDGSGFCV